MKLLKQKTSGHIYAWTPQLAQRDDMEPYERPTQTVPQENPNENPETAQSDTAPGLGIEDALKEFRKEAGKPPRKSKQPPGEA